MGMVEDFRRIKTEMAELREQAKQKAKGVFEEGTKMLFDKYPTLEEISFRCYTPYFNDGDACVYRSTHDDPEINGEEVSWQKDKRTELDNAVVDFLNNFDDDDMMDLFGDHVRVRITREGADTEHYDHD